MLTLELLKAMEPGKIFASGEIPNSSDGIYMTNERFGDMMRWVAKRGNYWDWAIYVDWQNKSTFEVSEYGQKVYDLKNVSKLVECNKEAVKLYRL